MKQVIRLGAVFAKSKQHAQLHKRNGLAKGEFKSYYLEKW